MFSMRAMALATLTVRSTQTGTTTGGALRMVRSRSAPSASSARTKSRARPRPHRARRRRHPHARRRHRSRRITRTPTRQLSFASGATPSTRATAHAPRTCSAVATTTAGAHLMERLRSALSASSAWTDPTPLLLAQSLLLLAQSLLLLTQSLLRHPRQSLSLHLACRSLKPRRVESIVSARCCSKDLVHVQSSSHPINGPCSTSGASLSIQRHCGVGRQAIVSTTVYACALATRRTISVRQFRAGAARLDASDRSERSSGRSL